MKYLKTWKKLWNFSTHEKNPCSLGILAAPHPKAINNFPRILGCCLFLTQVFQAFFNDFIWLSRPSLNKPNTRTQKSHFLCKLMVAKGETQCKCLFWYMIKVMFLIKRHSFAQNKICCLFHHSSSYVPAFASNFHKSKLIG